MMVELIMDNGRERCGTTAVTDDELNALRRESPINARRARSTLGEIGGLSPRPPIEFYAQAIVLC